MNEYIIMQHNRVVSPCDKVYFLGDVTMGRNTKALELLHRMNGEKILVKGNHDLAPASMYLEHFKDIRASHQLDGMLLTHIPIHPESFSRWKLNVHGHLHANKVTLRESVRPYSMPDDRYFNVSMECLDDYTPISLEQLKSKVKSVLES
jgi:calcineurin-like phosphoesterase family protein